jgi:DNA-binding MarR family transcriptional regulator
MVVYYSCCVEQTTRIRGFRRSLRVLEREAVRRLEGETGCCGVTLGQCHALLELSFSGSSLTGLATALDLDASTLSRTVESLVRAGWVERTRDAADRRTLRLALTAEGRRKVAEIDGICDRYYRALFDEMNERDRSAVVRAVKLLGGLMRAHRVAAESGASRCAAAGPQGSSK